MLLSIVRCELQHRGSISYVLYAVGGLLRWRECNKSRSRKLFHCSLLFFRALKIKKGADIAQNHSKAFFDCSTGTIYRSLVSILVIAVLVTAGASAAASWTYDADDDVAHDNTPSRLYRPLSRGKWFMPTMVILSSLLARRRGKILRCIASRCGSEGSHVLRSRTRQRAQNSA